jgi:hypothetical protein
LGLAVIKAFECANLKTRAVRLRRLGVTHASTRLDQELI